MRAGWIWLLCVCAACDGISIGGTDESEGARHDCSERTAHAELVADLSQPIHGLERLPSELLATASGAFTGALDATNGENVPLALEIMIDDDSVRAFFLAPFCCLNDGGQPGCPAWLTASVSIRVDAGLILKGTASGSLNTRDEATIRAWIPHDKNESTLPSPDFGAKSAIRPDLLLELTLQDDGAWYGAWWFTQAVTSSTCFPMSDTCFRSLNEHSAADKKLGDVILDARAKP